MVSICWLKISIKSFLGNISHRVIIVSKMYISTASSGKIDATASVASKKKEIRLKMCPCAAVLKEDKESLGIIFFKLCKFLKRNSPETSVENKARCGRQK